MGKIKYRQNKLFGQWFSVLTGLLATMVILSCQPEEHGPDEVIRDYEEAHNSHDIERLLTLVADDVQFQAGGLLTGTGKERLRELSAWDEAVNSRMDFEVVQITGDTAVCRIVERNDWYRGLGIPEVVHEGSIFVVRDGKIEQVISNPSPLVRKRISAGLAALKRWSDEHNDGEFDRLMSGGVFQYTPAAAAAWNDLFERWHESAGLDFRD